MKVEKTENFLSTDWLVKNLFVVNRKKNWKYFGHKDVNENLKFNTWNDILKNNQQSSVRHREDLEEEAARRRTNFVRFFYFIFFISLSPLPDHVDQPSSSDRKRNEKIRRKRRGTISRTSSSFASVWDLSFIFLFPFKIFIFFLSNRDRPTEMDKSRRIIVTRRKRNGS